MRDPENSLEDFAALCARLANPSTPRHAALADSGVTDERELVVLYDVWAVRLRDPSLRERFDHACFSAWSWLGGVSGDQRRGSTLRTMPGGGELDATCEAANAALDPSDLEATAELVPKRKA
jgi:hypothetical protein